MGFLVPKKWFWLQTQKKRGTICNCGIQTVVHEHFQPRIKRHTEGEAEQTNPPQRFCYDRGLEFEASLETRVHASCPWGTFCNVAHGRHWACGQFIKSWACGLSWTPTLQLARCEHVPAAACVEACTRSNTNVLILRNHVVLTRGSNISQANHTAVIAQFNIDTHNKNWVACIQESIFTSKSANIYICWKWENPII